MKPKISDNKCHNIDTNNQNDKIPESAPSEPRHTTTNKNICTNETDEKINNDIINNSMANNINFHSESEQKNKNNGDKNKGNCIDSNEATATVTTITIAVAKKTI